MTREEIVKELEEKLKKTIRADGFFVTVTALNEDKLDHYQCQADFHKDDIERSLIEVGMLAGVSLTKKSDILTGIERQRTWN